jgi:hypothetical protein
MKYGDQGFVNLADGSIVPASVIERKETVVSTCFGTFILSGGKWIYVVDGKSEFTLQS